MARLGKFISIILVLLLLSSTALQLTVKSQSIINQTLGPVTILSEGNNGTHVDIFAPQNQSSVKSPIELLFCVRLFELSYCGVGNIGYRVDGGTVYNVNEFMNQTVVREGFFNDVTVWANVTLPLLSEGNHNVTVYWGWVFDGENQRYDVWAYETVEFFVISQASTPNTSSSPSIPEFPITSSLLAVLVAISLLLVIGKKKQSIIKK